MSQTEVIILGGVFGFLGVLFILVLIVLIKNHNNFGKRLRNLEEIILNSENIYSSAMKQNLSMRINPLKGANWVQRGTEQVGQREQNFTYNGDKDLYGSNTARLSSLALQSAADYLQTSFPTQAGNLNPLGLIEGMGEFENLPDVGFAAELALGLPERPAFFPGASRITNNPLFKDAKRIVGEPIFKQNRNDNNNRLYY